MKWNKIKDWLYFSKKERTAILILVALIVVFFLIPVLFPKDAQKDVIAAEKIANNEPHFSESKSLTPTQLFRFDPNTLDADGWRKLGLREKTIQTLLHYRQKGGYFKVPDDIRKIYGLHKAEADRLVPLVVIDNSKEIAIQKTISQKNAGFSNKKYSFPLDANVAGIEHWAQLPGFNYSLATRIVHYRDAIHGFKTWEQIGKTYGMTPQLLQKIKPYIRLNTIEKNSTEPVDGLSEKKTMSTYRPSSQIVPVNINTATEQELTATRHISKSVAKAIVIYREQHGPYKATEDIRKIVFITPDMFQNMTPYIFVE